MRTGLNRKKLFQKFRNFITNPWTIALGCMPLAFYITELCLGAVDSISGLLCSIALVNVGFFASQAIRVGFHTVRAIQSAKDRDDIKPKMKRLFSGLAPRNLLANPWLYTLLATVMGAYAINKYMYNYLESDAIEELNAINVNEAIPLLERIADKIFDNPMVIASIPVSILYAAYQACKVGHHALKRLFFGRSKTDHDYSLPTVASQVTESHGIMSSAISFARAYTPGFIRSAFSKGSTTTAECLETEASKNKRSQAVVLFLK